MNVRTWLASSLIVLASSAYAVAPIAVLHLEGPIDPVQARYIERGMAKAVAEGAQCVVLQIDTPGGLLTSMHEIVRSLLTSTLPTVAFVGPSGSQAASAGAFVVLACNLTAMAPGTTMGAAHPVGGKGEDISSHLDLKVTNDTAAFIRSIAHDRGRDEVWAEAAVRKSVSVNETDAFKKKLIDAVAIDVPSLLKLLDGRTVKVNGIPKKLEFKDAPVIEIPMGLRERFFHMLAHPELAYILLSIGTLGLIFELQSPHGVSGVIGGICLVLALISLSIIPFSAGGLLLMGVGVGLFFLDIKLATHGILSIAGIVCLLLGSVMLFAPIEPFWHVSRVAILAVGVMTSSLFVGITYLGLQAQRTRPATGREAMIGSAGHAATALDPEGIVHLNGEDWSAALSDPRGRVKKGTEVVVTAVRGLKLEVEPADQGPGPRRPRARG